MIRPTLLLAVLACAACKRNEESAVESQAEEAPPHNFETPPAFWVWNRPSPLPAADLQQLEGSGVRLYWQVAELPGDAGEVPAELPPEATPVIRVATNVGNLMEAEDQIARVWGSIGPIGRFGRLQLDYDCPASRLRDYAALLNRLRSRLGLTELSVTALASWIDAPGFRSLTAAVDQIMPMFYDLEADDPAEIVGHRPRPMVGDSTLRWIAKWPSCPIPWRAGLPNFQRVSIFASDGTLIGHHRHCPLERLLGHPALEALESPPDSLIFSVLDNGALAGVPIRSGQMVVWRAPTRLDEAIAVAHDAGAIGTIWFAHPASAPQAAHSVTHLLTLDRLETPEPELELHVDSEGMLHLMNSGTGDLPLRPGASPWQLQLEAATPGFFGNPGPGEFLSVDAPQSSLSRPELARSLILEFAELRAGGECKTASHFVRDPEAGVPAWRIHPTP